MEHSSKSGTAAEDVEEDACHYVRPVRAEVFECMSDNHDGGEMRGKDENSYRSATLMGRNPHTKQSGSQSAVASAQTSSLRVPCGTAITEEKENGEGVFSGFSREDALAELRKMLCIMDPQQLQLHADVTLRAHPPATAFSLVSSSSDREIVPVHRNASQTPLFLPSCASSSSSFSLTEVSMRELRQLQEACQIGSDWCVERKGKYEEKIQATRAKATMQTESFLLGERSGENNGMSLDGLREEERKGEGKQKMVGVTALLFQHVLLECFRFIQPSVSVASSFPSHEANGRSESRSRAAVSSSPVPSAASASAFHTAKAFLQLPQLLLSNWRREAHEMLRLFQRLKEDEEVENTKRREKIKKNHPERPEGDLPLPLHSPTPTSGSESLPTVWDKSSAWCYRIERRLQQTASFRSAVARLIQLLPLGSSGKANHKTKVRTIPSFGCGANCSDTACSSSGGALPFPRPAKFPPQTAKEGGRIATKRSAGVEEKPYLEPLQDEEEEDIDDFSCLSATVLPFTASGNVEETGTSSSSFLGCPLSDVSRYLSRLQLFAPLLSEAATRREMMQVIHSHGISLEDAEDQMTRHPATEVKRDVDQKEQSVALLESWRNTLQEVHEKCIAESARQLHDNLSSITERCKELNISLEGMK